MPNFIKVTDPSHLIPTVEWRLPDSSAVYNQLKSFHKLTDYLEVLEYGENTDESLWVITKFLREDWGPWMSISAPGPEHLGEVPEDVKQSFISGEVFNWGEGYVLTSPMHVSKFIMDWNWDVLGHILTVYPSYLFHMKPEEALKLELSPPPGTRVKPLDPETGTPFIADNWEYRREGTASTVRKGIESLHSGGVFLNGNETPVCGTLTAGFGLVSMLHTDPDHRRKGYASLVMKYMFQEMAKDGLQPCLASVIDNTTAVNFHHSLGLSPVAKMTIMVQGH